MAQTASRSRSGSSLNRVPEVKLSAKQRQFVLDPSRFPLYRGAIRSGKTYAGAIRSINRRYQFPGTTQLIGGPSWSQLRDGTIRTLLRLINPACIERFNETTLHIVLTNGSEFLTRTLDNPDVMRAIEAHDAWIDEIAMVSEEALDIGIARVSLPYADPEFSNSLWGTTTPRGVDWTLGVWGMEGRPDYGVTHSTIYDNAINLPDGLIASLEEKYRDTPFFEQELLGMYTAFEGLVYPMFLASKHVTDDPWPVHESDRVIVGGPDWGGAMPSAMYLIGERQGRAHVYEEFYRKGADLSDISATLDDWVQLSRIRKGLLRIDYDGAETVSGETLRREKGFSAARAADKDREGGIKLVQERLNGDGRGPLLTFSRRCPNVIGEFGQYIWASKRDATTKVLFQTNTPIDHHADGLDAVRYGCMGLRTGIRPDMSKVGKPVSRYGGTVQL